MTLSKHSNGFYYIFYFQPNGKRTCISTGTKAKSEALKFLSQFEKEIENRKIQKLGQIYMDIYCKEFLNHSKTIHSIKTQKGYELSISYLQRNFGNIPLSEITSQKLTEYFEQRINTSSIFQARKDLICFNSFFNKAVAEGYLIVNPCKNIKRFKLPQRQPLFFTELQFDLLLNVIKEKDIKDLVIFAVNTGLRQMELITLEWNQINFKDRYLILDNHNHITKSKKIRTVPLSIKAMQILSEREIKKHGEIIFTLNGRPISQDFISHKFRSYILEAGINPKLNFHSLRHTFASWLVQRGVSIYEVSKLLGHSSISVTEIYSHLTGQNLMDAVNKLNN